ncbi:uncharacterized protein BDZ99DRAFT_518166 [Mytilinidion resinicola]|uniref:Nucleotide-diphospho-sugar transferase domain-containing protein n=1 Tax=Mytilinidion resinicola TaxID=574789 RepID=A0A6A6YTR4_9PEZI|nr:uncharacterized protein BDZ99DRAFT_518166 [Mytilinidion resinicola]KAF2812312.1 hypothetical protein BDZ99DRAFT_518166 [Mytilinidion resinicola]
MFAFTYFAWNNAFFSANYEPLPPPPVPVNDTNAMDEVLRLIYGPMLQPITAANFTDEDGDVYQLPGPPRFTKPLGKRVLILDIDSRPLDGPGQIMNKDKMEWHDARSLTAGMLSHYMFAKIHGYDYKFIRAPDYPDRWGTWVKVPMMKEALKTHDFVAFMDSDVMFHYPHIPLEWLMNYWNITAENLVAMSIDPDEAQNYDGRGNRYVNTGFVIAQQSKRTQEMYKAWAECPSDTRYKDCARWGFEWAHEQAAFGNHIRYDFDRPEDIKVLPCVEANGAPEAAGRGGCKGVFVRHFWVDKQLPLKALSDQVMQYFVPRMHEHYIEQSPKHIVDAKGFKIVGADLVALTEEEKAEVKEPQNQKEVP